MGQPVAFFEVVSPDHERAQRFCAELVGRAVDADPALGGYGLVHTGAGEGAIGGGTVPAEEPGEAGTRIAVRVPGPDAALHRAEELGGTRLVPPTDLPGGSGRFAVPADPDGNRAGLRA